MHIITCANVMCEFYRLIQKNPCAWLFVGCCFLKVSSPVIASAFNFLLCLNCIFCSIIKTMAK